MPTKHLTAAAAEAAEALANLELRMTEMEQRQRAHLELSEEVRNLAETTATNTREVVDLLAAFKGAFTVMDFIGKGARPVLWLTSLGAAIAVAWAEIRGHK